MIVLIVEAVAFQTSMVATNRDWQMDVVASNEDARQRLAEALVLSNATVSSSGANVTLTFANTGSTVAYVDHIWVINTTDTNPQIHKSFPLNGLPVAPGPPLTHTLVFGTNIDPSGTYCFKAVTTRGNTAQICYPLGSASKNTNGTTNYTTVSTTSYTTVSTTSSTTISTTSYTTVSTTSYTTTSTTISTTSYTTLSTTSSTTSYTTVSTTSSTTISTTSYTTTSTTISTTSYTTVSTTSYTTISTTINNNSPAMISGTMMIAYQPKDKQGYNSTTDTCHKESKTKLTGISGLYTGTFLSFVNPWLNTTILNSATSQNGNHTMMYYLVNATNTMSTSIVASAGTIDLTWYGSNHINGPLFGVYYGGKFYNVLTTSPPTMAPGSQFYAIYRISDIELSGFPGTAFFIGSAAITNNLEGSTYYSAQLAIDGLWVRSSC
jgi:hypothetical protein